MAETTADAEISGNGEVKRHVQDRSTWTRLLYMLILAVAWTVAEVVLIAVAVLQFLMLLFTGKPLETLVAFGRNLSEYMAEIARFETFASDKLAFPFEPWPSVSK